MSEKLLTIREERRYENQIALEGFGRKGQELLKQAKVLVIGAGGKGTTTLKNLITAGIGNLGVCDDKLVNEDSLSKQSLFGDNDVGKQKAIVVKQYLQTKNQFTNINVHNIQATSQNLPNIIANYDIVVDSTNSFETHLVIASAAKSEKKPLVLGNIHKNKSIVKVFTNEGKSFAEIFSGHKFVDIGESDILTPVVIINSLTGTVLANEVVNIILNRPSQLIDNMLIINVSDYTFGLQPV